jgi:xylulose-5-phosphate/fructose-6-phosphate phosphoketolase
VLPILHLNGFKIANPTVLARIDRDELTNLLRGYGHEPHYVEGDDPAAVHQLLAATLDAVLAEIQDIQAIARSGRDTVERPRWPMIVFKTPKGWTGPKTVDGLPVEGTWRAHQVPIASFDKPEHLHQLEEWMLSYRPAELFDEAGKFREDYASLAPTGHRRMGPIHMPMAVHCSSRCRYPIFATLRSLSANPVESWPKQLASSVAICAKS